MWTSALSVSLLLMTVFVVADTVRPLKEEPIIDCEGREYKFLRANKGKCRETQVKDESTVRVACTESSMIVVVKADLYKTGRLVSAEELFLGEADHSQSSRCRAEAAADSEFIIEAGLQDCGSELTMTEDSVIYSNKLIVSPAVTYQGITRTNPAVVPVSCHYKRTHFVSSISQPILPTPSSPTVTSDFSLRLMNDDWTHETFSTVFFLGDVLHLQASYTGPDSPQRRLLIDSCVATLKPDVTSVPRYYFIQNHGCLTDAKNGGSNTHFRPRTRTNSLELQMDVFLFHQDTRNSIFITCHVKAVADMWRSSFTNKACDHTHSGWENVDGVDDVCRCCDGSCYTTSLTWSDLTNVRPPASKDVAVCGRVMLGPLVIYPIK
ncbi:zona pellucida sperm-binding protein 3 [Labrus bergylta]|uniref:Zona pellucida sperm-binding protein 3 n=1 Tax=Labrus bergylta TaxID=56723 RepID=A0A3Q3EV59_9LABR|nr:zona pellucida sperm-binding protein 3-like [Labrus bergylta]